MTKEKAWEALRLLQHLYAQTASYAARHGRPDEAAAIVRTGYEEDCRFRKIWDLPHDPACYASADLTALLDEDGWPQVLSYALPEE
jgi:hypothetical protein